MFLKGDKRACVSEISISRVEDVHEVDRFITLLKNKVTGHASLEKEKQKKSSFSYLFGSLTKRSSTRRIRSITKCGDMVSPKKSSDLFMSPEFLKLIYKYSRYYNYNFFKPKSEIELFKGIKDKVNELGDLASSGGQKLDYENGDAYPAKPLGTFARVVKSFKNRYGLVTKPFKSW
jgi:hypothetical protein